MIVTMYLYHNVVENHEIYLKRCDKCNRALFKYSSKNLVISNHGPSNYDVYEPGSKFIEIICHSCHTKYNIQFM